MGRLRVTFGRGEPIKYVSHLDLVRLWERAFRRAGVPLAYSAGFTPRPKLKVAAPLPVGVTSEAELMDLVLDEDWTPDVFAARVTPQLPIGITLIDVSPAPAGGPSLPAAISAADYRVVLATAEPPEAVRERIDRILAAETLVRVRDRAGKPRRYDLRPLILDLRHAGADPEGQAVETRLRLSNDGGGRPDEVALALGYDERPRRIHRTRILCQAATILGSTVDSDRQEATVRHG